MPETGLFSSSVENLRDEKEILGMKKDLSAPL